jgi:alpha-galactosidase
MKPGAWPCLFSCFLSPCLIAADALPGTIRVGNADNQVALEPGASTPQLLRLTRAGGASWEGPGAEALIGSVTVDGASVPLHWRFDRKSSRIREDSASLVYETRHPDLRLSWSWQARARHGPIEHAIRIENLGAREVWLPLQDSFRFRWRIDAGRPLEQLWIDKGAGEPPAIGTHRVAVNDGYDWRGLSSTFAHPRGGEPREIIPYFLVRAAGANALGGWYAGVEFSGRVALGLQRHGGELAGTIGLNPSPGPYRTRLAPHASFTTPTVFVGASNGDIDDTGNVLRRWVRAALNDPRTLANPHYPLLVNNSWGSAMAITDAQARRMIDDAHALGFEMFHLDAGWFRAVGDWHADPLKFPHGIAAVADYAHARGMKFGLWVDWAQAGTSKEPGALNLDDAATRDWLTTDPPLGWKPAEFKGITIDLGVPAAQAWASREVDRIVGDYHVDMLEHDGYVVAQTCDRDDHPHAPIDPRQTSRYVDDEFLWVDSSNSTDVSYHAARAYYAIHDGLKRAHPGLLLEVCNDGGRMVDFGSAAHADYFSIVDSYDPLSNRQAFYDASHVLPPAMLETYVKAVPTPRIENFRYMLRSGMMGWLSVMIDTTAWSREQHEAARAELRLYKTVLRPLIRAADLYHVAPRADGKGWDGIEYFDPTRGRGVLYAFHGSDAAPKTHTYPLRGLQARRTYRVRFNDHSAPDFSRNGGELMRTGVTVSLPLPESSELVLIEAKE